jgi:hypothetical protein
MEDSFSIQELNYAFDVSGLLDEQILLLEEIKPALEKIVVIDNQKEKIILESGDVNWEESLSLFTKADINSPKMIGLYTYFESDSAGYQSRNYTLKPNEIGSIKHLIIIDYPNGDMEISAVERMKNPISISSIHMRMHYIKNAASEFMLDSYAAEGYQKILTMDTVFFAVYGKVIYKRHK